jgi:hypothetical protein
VSGLQLVRVLKPFGLIPPVRGAVDVLEAPIGSFDRWCLVVGSRVTADDDLT